MMQESELYKSLENFEKEKKFESEKIFYKQLKEVRFYSFAFKNNGKSTICTIKRDDDTEFYPAFTNYNELAKWPFEVKDIIRLSFDDLKHIILEDKRNIGGIVINPFGRSILFENHSIKRMDAVISGMYLKRTEGITKGMYLYYPQEVPQGLKNGINLYLSNNKRKVYGVYLYQAKRNITEPLHWLFLIEFDGDKLSLFPKFAKIVQIYMKPGDVFELVKYNGELQPGGMVRPYIIYKNS